MSPLSLLFSSDQETSRMLRQALYELEFEVEHCTEIFAAVEKLTSKSYDVIVTDFDDGLEASFLLKTSRELKANSGAFTLAVTSDRDANAAARKVGADLVLNKPIVSEVAKYRLLTSDAFLRSMRNWLPKLNFAKISLVQSHINSVTAAVTPLASDKSKERGSSSPSDFRQVALPIPKFDEPFGMWPYESKKRAKGHHRSSMFVFIAAMAMVFLSVGYVFSEPTRSQAMVTSVATVCEKAIAKTESWLKTPEDGEQGGSEWAQNGDSEPSAQRRAPRIRVTEIHDTPQAIAPAPITPPPPLSAENPPAPSQLARLSTGPVIPESLRTPISGTASAAPPKVSASLLDGLPIDLPEEMSERLLLQKVEPSYPQRARQAGVQGPVVLRAWIGKDGTIEDLKLIRGSLLLGEAAYHAVKQWKYRPYVLNGQAVEAETYVTVNFTLH